MTTDRAASPCRKICKLSAGDRVCTGCGRTLDEIAGWSSLSLTEREAVNAAAARRLARFPAG
ncbi:MAG: DUF1289 domain-containing protein [Erythrobacter sp.]|nr:DUF1289 domain-containing protein [Erythrobacter sp.]